MNASVARGLAGGLLLLALWEAVVRLAQVPPWILPPPSGIVATTWSARGPLLDAGAMTLFEAVAGYGIGMLPRRLLDGLQYDSRGAPKGWAVPLAHFEATHCVLYSPQGRRRVAELLKPPIRLQTDGLLSLYAKRGILRVLVQTGRASAGQTSTLHTSTVQVPCLLCALPASSLFCSALVSLGLLVFLFLLVTLRVARVHG